MSAGAKKGHRVCAQHQNRVAARHPEHAANAGALHTAASMLAGGLMHGTQTLSFPFYQDKLYIPVAMWQHGPGTRNKPILQGTHHSVASTHQHSTSTVHMMTVTNFLACHSHMPAAAFLTPAQKQHSVHCITCASFCRPSQYWQWSA